MWVRKCDAEMEGGLLAKQQTYDTTKELQGNSLEQAADSAGILLVQLHWPAPGTAGASVLAACLQTRLWQAGTHPPRYTHSFPARLRALWLTQPGMRDLCQAGARWVSHMQHHLQLEFELPCTCIGTLAS